MHKDEVWQAYAPNGEPIEGKGWQAALGNPIAPELKTIIGVAIVIIYRKMGGILEILWQKRSERVDRFPGDYDYAAGGHINLGERPIAAAVREAREEIGASVEENELRLIAVRPLKHFQIGWIYAVDWTDKAEDFNFDDGEVSEVRWVPHSETEEFRAQYAKAPIKKDALTFELLNKWLMQNGDL